MAAPSSKWKKIRLEMSPRGPATRPRQGSEQGEGPWGQTRDSAETELLGLRTAVDEAGAAARPLAQKLWAEPGSEHPQPLTEPLHAAPPTPGLPSWPPAPDSAARSAPEPGSGGGKSPIFTDAAEDVTVAVGPMAGLYCAAK